jgi:glycosyltransferase involved in cell wall biosynthesis
MTDWSQARVRSVAMLGNYLPRHCGIATFTTHLTSALLDPDLELSCSVLAMNDANNRYAYDDRVVFEITESSPAAYRRAADFINVGGFDVLCLQHEYGIFGGKAGVHILGTLSQVVAPIVTTLHTILENPSPPQARVIEEVLRLSTRVVVMSENGAALLRKVHGIPSEKIDVIPHGIPLLPDRELSRARLKVGSHLQLLTFGLLSPDKGIEFVIDALPDVVRRFPEVRYAIVGATHPQVKEHHGEAYRRSLQLRAHKLGVADHVVFHDRFVSDKELGEFLAAADIYITPYLNPEQITSGTLAYAVGTGKVAVSTPYRYAEELLADGRGVLVPWRDGSAISGTVNRLLGDPNERSAIEARAAAYGEKMTWKSVASQYRESFIQAQKQSTDERRTRSIPARSLGPRVELPELDLRHVVTLTDDTGILQHAHFAVPRYEDGYCIDDNARALLLMTLIDDAGTDDPHTTRRLSSRYLAFINHAFHSEIHRFRNFMDYGRRWTEESGSEDSHGRTLWALGTVVGRAEKKERRGLALQLFSQALSSIKEFASPRALAFTLLGIAEYLKAFGGDREVENLQRALSNHLLSKFSRDFQKAWPWCETSLSYDNARLPQALIVSGQSLGDQELIRSGLGALGWLCEQQVATSGVFSPVGSDGFFPRSGTKAKFDQQPIEACATVSACLEAWRIAGDERWVSEMWRAFGWFMGENEGNTPLYDPATQGCRDGLHPDRANENQGAESTLSFLLSLVDMRALAVEMRVAQGLV